MQLSFMLPVTGEANISMDSTCLTVGGFSQPSVAHVLIEQNGSAEIGLSQCIYGYSHNQHIHAFAPWKQSTVILRKV